MGCPSTTTYVTECITRHFMLRYGPCTPHPPEINCDRPLCQIDKPSEFCIAHVASKCPSGQPQHPGQKCSQHISHTVITCAACHSCHTGLSQLSTFTARKQGYCNCRHGWLNKHAQSLLKCLQRPDADHPAAGALDVARLAVEPTAYFAAQVEITGNCCIALLPQDALNALQ